MNMMIATLPDAMDQEHVPTAVQNGRGDRDHLST